MSGQYNPDGAFPRKFKTIKCTCPRNRYSLNCNIRAHREIAMDIQRVFCDFKKSRRKEKKYQSFADKCNRYSRFLVTLIITFLILLLLSQTATLVEKKAKADARTVKHIEIDWRTKPNGS